MELAVHVQGQARLAVGQRQGAAQLAVQLREVGGAGGAAAVGPQDGQPDCPIPNPDQGRQ